MSKFLTKIGMLALAFTNLSIVHAAAETQSSLNELAIEIVNAPAAATLTIQKCVLDFSSTTTTAASSGRIAVYLLSEKTNSTLDFIDIAYLTFEGIAAGARKEQARFGKLAPYFTDKDAVYTNFLQIAGSIEKTQHELSVLANLKTCTAFVQKTVTTDLPTLLTKLNVSTEDQADITLLATVFTPMFAKLLNKTYKGALAAGAAFNEKSSWCGCFGSSDAVVDHKTTTSGHTAVPAVDPDNKS